MWEFLAGLGVGNMLSDSNGGGNGRDVKLLVHRMEQIGIMLAVLKAGKRLDNEINRRHAGEREKSYAYRAILEVLKEVDADALPEEHRETYDSLCLALENNI